MAGSPGSDEQRIILHVPRPDLEHVCITLHDIHVVRVDAAGLAEVRSLLGRLAYCIGSPPATTVRELASDSRISGGIALAIPIATCSPPGRFRPLRPFDSMSWMTPSTCSAVASACMR